MLQGSLGPADISKYVFEGNENGEVLCCDGNA